MGLLHGAFQNTVNGNKELSQQPPLKQPKKLLLLRGRTRAEEEKFIHGRCIWCLHKVKSLRSSSLSRRLGVRTEVLLNLQLLGYWTDSSILPDKTDQI